ncbi:GrpB family protein [Effusibacillus consociatus]|uniref:GrpB family protein n=1 Tax=Effusibacillus consociatus TaxID=1117041 RepID=A0ABV9Q0Q1_9BACL
MEIVHFSNVGDFRHKAERLFEEQKRRIEERLPNADIQHVGSTAVPGSLTKGDVDIQVRVLPEVFSIAIQVLSSLYSPNEGSVSTDSFRAFKDDTLDPPLGVQLSVIGSEYDFFWKLRNVLLANETYRQEYDELKKRFHGKDMDEYRTEKNKFFKRLMTTPEYLQL